MRLRKKKMGPVFFTYRADVPVKPGQTLAFKRWKGYYAAGEAWKLVPKRPRKEPTARERYVRWLRWAAQHEHQIHYEQRRPIPVHLPAATLPITTDCSGLLTLLAKWAHCPDPNGQGFSGEGFTGTMLDHLPEIEPRHAQPGDLIVYGSGTGQHVVAITERADGDFIVCSHGQELGPILLRHSEEKRHQPEPSRFLSFL